MAAVSKDLEAAGENLCISRPHLLVSRKLEAPLGQLGGESGLGCHKTAHRQRKEGEPRGAGDAQLVAGDGQQVGLA